jgi:hypothetical protein
MVRFLKIFICLTSSTYSLGVEKCCSLSHSDTHTISRTPLDEGSVHRRDHYLTTRNILERYTSPSGSRTRNPRKRAVSERRLRPRGHRIQPVYKFLSIK